MGALNKAVMVEEGTSSFYSLFCLIDASAYKTDSPEIKEFSNTFTDARPSSSLNETLNIPILLSKHH